MNPVDIPDRLEFTVRRIAALVSLPLSVAILTAGSMPALTEASGAARPSGQDGLRPTTEFSAAVPVFRVYRYVPSHPALLDKDITAGATIEELEDD